MSFCLVCIIVFFVACQPTKNVERDISVFNSGWQAVNTEKQSDNIKTIWKEFDVKIDSDKLYLIELFSNADIYLKLNDNIIHGIKTNNGFLFNLSEDLQKQNMIKIHSSQNIHLENGNPDLEIKMLCVNKLFIPELKVGISNSVTQPKTLQVEVRVKNAFETEKQGVLVYQLYNDKNKEQLVRETPVFISGNAENIYRQDLRLENDLFSGREIKLECKIFSNEILFDSNYKVLTINKETLLSAN